MKINFKKLNPVCFHLLHYINDTSVRFIFMFGGSSSGKSYSVAQAILIQTLYDGENTVVYRKVGASVKDSIYEDFKVAAKQLGIFNLFKFGEGINKITCLSNGAKIDFKGMDNSEKIKGISNYKRVCLEEWSEFENEDYKQVRKRLRGKKGQQIICTWNPIRETHWIKVNVLDKEAWHDVSMRVSFGGIELPEEITKVKSIRMNASKVFMDPKTGEAVEHLPDMVIIQTTYLNNFWVVGSPDGSYGFYDEQCIADFERDRINDPDYYNVYALGEWGVIRTGSEFFGSFNRGQHVAPCAYNPDLPIHVSVDNNVLPYISYSLWQIEYGDTTHIRQIDELPAESPHNTARKSALLLAAKLKGMGVDSVYLHGDASTRNASTIDDQKRSFLDLVISTLEAEGIEVKDCVGNKNPNVAMSGEFINAIYDHIIPGITITIGEHCNTSIEDYMSVQKDENGAILKTRVKNKVTGQSYEEHGHISDTKRYVVCDLVKEDFLAFSNRRKRNLYARDGFINFYNPDTECKYSDDLLYCMPNINGRLVFVYGKKCGDKWHLTRIGFKETASTEEIKAVLSECKSGRVILECSKSYLPMARDLRDGLEGDVRVLAESGDIPRRIAATSDYVKSSILFNEHAFNDDEQYSGYLTNMLDYNKDSGDNIEASAVLSGFIQVIVKLGL